MGEGGLGWRGSPPHVVFVGKCAIALQEVISGSGRLACFLKHRERMELKGKNPIRVCHNAVWGSLQRFCVGVVVEDEEKGGR